VKETGNKSTLGAQGRTGVSIQAPEIGVDKKGIQDGRLIFAPVGRITLIFIVAHRAKKKGGTCGRFFRSNRYGLRLPKSAES